MSSFRIYNKNLCPDLWDEYKHLDPEVRVNLLRMAYDFYKKTKFIAPIIDVWLMGSIANYNWSPESDVDVHIIVDFFQLEMPPETACKSAKSSGAQWNIEHDIFVKGHKVEINIQSVRAEKPYVTGIYSLMEDKWLRVPQLQNINVNKNTIQLKFSEIKKYIQSTIDSGNRESMKQAKDYLDDFRQYGLDTEGELSVENIVYKILRSKGIIKMLKDAITKVYDKEMTVKEDGELGRVDEEILKESEGHLGDTEGAFWWLDPNNKFHRVSMNGHEAFAINYLIERGHPPISGEKAYTQLIEMGWVRVGIDFDFNYSKIIEYYYNPRKKPTSRQLKAIKDLGIIKKCSQIRDINNRNVSHIDEASQRDVKEKLPLPTAWDNNGIKLEMVTLDNLKALLTKDLRLLKSILKNPDPEYFKKSDTISLKIRIQFLKDEIKSRLEQINEPIKENDFKLGQEHDVDLMKDKRMKLPTIRHTAGSKSWIDIKDCPENKEFTNLFSIDPTTGKCELDISPEQYKKYMADRYNSARLAAAEKDIDIDQLPKRSDLKKENKLGPEHEKDPTGRGRIKIPVAGREGERSGEWMDFRTDDETPLKKSWHKVYSALLRKYSENEKSMIPSIESIHKAEQIADKLLNIKRNNKDKPVDKDGNVLWENSIEEGCGGVGYGNPEKDPLHIPGERWRIKWGGRKTPKMPQNESNDPSYDVSVDFMERRENQLIDLARLLKNSKGKGKVLWKTVPASLLKKIWLEFGKRGTIRDENGLDKIADQILTNIARLQASTEMMGHTMHDVKPELLDLGYEFSDKEWDEWMSNYFTDERGSWRLSNYGLEPLKNIYVQIFNADTPEEKLYAIDKALNVVHQRSDLAAMFVEGGSATLTAIANQGGYVEKDEVKELARSMVNEYFNKIS